MRSSATSAFLFVLLTSVTSTFAVASDKPPMYCGVGYKRDGFQLEYTDHGGYSNRRWTAKGAFTDEGVTFNFSAILRLGGSADLTLILATTTPDGIVIEAESSSEQIPIPRNSLASRKLTVSLSYNGTKRSVNCGLF